MSGNLYETPKLVGEYLLLHYGSIADVLDGAPGPADAVDFPVRLVRELLAPTDPDSRALDLGCAVGGSSFELARSCVQVLGVDYSHAFIAAANHLRDSGEHRGEKVIEGDLRAPFTVSVPEGIDRSRVSFTQGDAMEFPTERDFDVVLAANLLCRLTDPQRLIDRLPHLVRPGGQLLLTTPFTWLEEFTPRENWLGGTPAAGRSIDVLTARLAPHFALEHCTDLPFLIREHSRKFQFGIACGTRWRRL